MRNNFEKLYEYEFNLRKIAEQECFRNKALADKRLVLLRHTKKTMDSALRSLKAIGNSSYMPIMNRLERMIEMTEKELADE